MRKLIAALILSFFTGAPVFAYHEYAGGPIIVNGQELNSGDGLALMQQYGVIPAGNYWYDPASGLWGVAGGPSSGQISPGLALGGRLKSSASAGGTGVFINGREIHPEEYMALLNLYGTVIPGRYWMNAHLVGGFEGGPAIFDLNAANSVASGGASAGGSGYNRNTAGGSLMSDGNCSAYLHPSGASVMTGNC